MKKKTIAVRVALAVSTWFGCGYAPFGPGTVGSAAALLIGVWLVQGAGWRPLEFAGLAAVATAPAMWASGVTARHLGRKDPGLVVVDEVLGQWIALAGAAAFNWKTFLGAFLLFRAFDILKPPPVRQLESLPGGIGIVADDLMAGIYSALVLFLAGWFNLY